MTVGPTLGTGLFVGTGQALAAGGPASLIIAYVFISAMTYCVTTAVAEISTHSITRNGAMLAHNYHYISSHVGFAIAYLRWIGLSLLVPFEVTAGMVHLGLWEPSASLALRMGGMMFVIFFFNMLPEKFFRRSQAFFTGIKFLATIGLAIISFYLAIRASQPGAAVGGFEYWVRPGPFAEFLLIGDLGRFLGFLFCILCSTISFVFLPELTVQVAEDHDSEPGNSIFKYTRNSNLIMFILYMLSTLTTTLMAPYDDLRLNNSFIGAGLSPYMVGLVDSRIRLIPAVGSGLIFLSSVASGRSFLNLASRMLSTMAETGHAPALFMIRNRWNVPYMSVAISAGFTWLCFLCMAISSSEVYNYLMFFITTIGYVSWVCSLVAYLRFRRMVKKSEIMPLHRSFIQPFGTYFALGASVLLIMLNLSQIMVAPRHGLNPLNGIPAHIALNLFGLFYGGHRLVVAVRKKAARLEPHVVEYRGDEDEDQPQDQVIEMEEMQARRPEDELSTTPTHAVNSRG
ncbi:putative proline permease [Aspergillus foveolatus]|uniref:putative proline permease n=1 Tax=Aspergillus foveolatus TaxID=210207 RepID=UPI003CCCF4C0